MARKRARSAGTRAPPSKRRRRQARATRQAAHEDEQRCAPSASTDNNDCIEEDSDETPPAEEAPTDSEDAGGGAGNDVQTDDDSASDEEFAMLSKADRGIGALPRRSSDSAQALMQEQKEVKDKDEKARRKMRAQEKREARAAAERQKNAEREKEFTALEHVVCDGWTNISDVPLRSKIGCVEPEARPADGIHVDPECCTSIADMFVRMIGEDTLDAIAERCEGKVQTKRDGRPRGLKKEVSRKQVKAMIGVHCLRATGWSAKGANVDSFFRSCNATLPLGSKAYKALLHLVGELDELDCAYVQSKLVQAMRATIKPGAERVIDEWLDSFELGSWFFADIACEADDMILVDAGRYLIYIPRKPHKIGHLHFLLASKVKIGTDKRGAPIYCVFVSDVVSHMAHRKPTPSDAWREIVGRDEGGACERVLYVGDMAFCTADVLSFNKERDKLFLLSGGNYPELKTAAQQQLRSYTSRNFASPDGLVFTVCKGKTRQDEDFGKKLSGVRIITNVCNYLEFGQRERCICRKSFAEADARVFLNFAVQALRDICIWKGVPASDNRYMMVKDLTGFNFASEEREVCGFCSHRNAVLKTHASKEEMEAAREARVAQLLRPAKDGGKTAKQLEVMMAELGIKKKTGDNKAKVAKRIATAEICSTSQFKRLLKFYRAQVRGACREGDCETSDRYILTSNAVDMFNRLLYEFRFPVSLVTWFGG